MGAEQSAESRKKELERQERMFKNALEQQRKMYEERCNDLRKAHHVIATSTKNSECTQQVEMAKLKIELEKQKMKFEAKYHQLVQEQKIKEATESCGRQNIASTIVCSQTQGNYAPLYPSLQQVPTVEMQPSTSSAQFHAHPSNIPNQNKSIFSQPSAPVPPLAPEASLTSQKGDRQNQRNKAKNGTYQCPTCKLNSLEINIFQCQKGHSSCSQCKMNAVNCGVCKSPITNTRNIELERLVANLPKNNVKNTEKVHCPNKIDGCSLSFRPENLQAHLKECIFREMECPLTSAKFSACSWRGKINHMQAHFLEYHPEQTTANIDTETCFESLTKNYDIHYVAMGNFNFLVHVKLEPEGVFMSVQLIGSLMSASKWLYEFNIYQKSEPRRKFTYVDSCLPTSMPFTDVVNKTKCLVMPLQYASSFFKDNKLTYKFYIKRDESVTRPNPRRFYRPS